MPHDADGEFQRQEEVTRVDSTTTPQVPLSSMCFSSLLLLLLNGRYAQCISVSKENARENDDGRQEWDRY